MKKVGSTDLLFLTGLAATATGLWLYSPALSLVITGIILMALAVARALREANK